MDISGGCANGKRKERKRMLLKTSVGGG